MRLNSPWFEYLVTGHKRYEGLRVSSRTAHYRVGDIITIQHQIDQSRPLLFCRITSLRVYPDFAAALQEVEYSAVLPGVASAEEAINIYKQRYSLAMQRRRGIMLVGLVAVQENNFGEQKWTGRPLV